MKHAYFDNTRCKVAALKEPPPLFSRTSPRLPRVKIVAICLEWLSGVGLLALPVAKRF